MWSFYKSTRCSLDHLKVCWRTRSSGFGVHAAVSKANWGHIKNKTAIQIVSIEFRLSLFIYIYSIFLYNTFFFVSKVRSSMCSVSILVFIQQSISKSAFIASISSWGAKQQFNYIWNNSSKTMRRSPVHSTAHIIFSIACFLLYVYSMSLCPINSLSNQAATV